MNAPIPGLDFVAVDFETANRHRGSPCSIGMVRVRDGVIVKEAYRLMRPPASVGGGIFEARNVAVHGITARDVADKPAFADVHRWIVDGIAEDLLVAHNAAFDSAVLRQACRAELLPAPTNEWLCTQKTAKRLLPSLGHYTLDAVAEHLGLPPFDHHEALADARTCALILISLAAVSRDLVEQARSA